MDNKNSKIAKIAVITVVIILVAGAVYYYGFYRPVLPKPVTMERNINLGNQFVKPLQIHLSPSYVQNYVVEIQQNSIRALSNGSKQAVVSYVAVQPFGAIYNYFKSFFQNTGFEINSDSLQESGFTLGASRSGENYTISAADLPGPVKQSLVTISLLVK